MMCYASSVHLTGNRVLWPKKGPHKAGLLLLLQCCLVSYQQYTLLVEQVANLVVLER